MRGYNIHMPELDQHFIPVRDVIGARIVSMVSAG